MQRLFRVCAPQIARTVQQFSRPQVIRGVVGLSAITAASLWSDCDAKVPHAGVPGTVNERTFIAVKPDGVQRGLIAEIIRRFETRGYKLVALKMVTPTPEMAAEHYGDLKTKPFFAGLVQFFSSGPVVAMVWEGPGVIKQGRVMLGATDPQAAPAGSIRSDLCVTVGRNICHGSDGPESAKHEIEFWFKESELNNWNRSTDQWTFSK
eukprot:c8723_g1_i1.p1 GENE.c8723_g1_i1~~c8723_g1_i1.p1  ORF type:complete len:207 (+),score=96.43 c8723_g1_i1:32-652(+)